jgi:ribose/xylose/arabinose/galactoside ABC-type transport system permease subunit
MNVTRTNFFTTKPVEWIRANINLMILLLMIALGSLISEQFLTLSNWQNILRQVAINGIMAAGVTSVFLAGGFDLSIGATLSLCGCLAVGLQATLPMGFAVSIALVVGAFIGFLNGQLIKITRGDLSETFLITLGVSLLVTSIALTYTNGQSLFTERGSAYSYWGQGKISGVPFSALIFILILIILEIVLKKTQFGRKIYLTGGNKVAAYLSGINTNRIKSSTFVIAGICAALAGIVMSSRTTAAIYSMGNGYDFDACIAVLIGGNVLGGGKGGMIQTFIGVMIFGLISNVLNLATITPVVQIILKGVILLLAVLLNGIKRK